MVQFHLNLVYLIFPISVNLAYTIQNIWTYIDCLDLAMYNPNNQ